MRSYKLIEFGPFTPRMEHCILTRIPICERHQENSADFKDIRFAGRRELRFPTPLGRSTLRIATSLIETIENRKLNGSGLIF